MSSLQICPLSHVHRTHGRSRATNVFKRLTIIMPPTSQRICLTVIEATKNFCITLPTLEGLKLALTKFHREVRELPPDFFFIRSDRNISSSSSALSLFICCCPASMVSLPKVSFQRHVLLRLHNTSCHGSRYP
jgi:hypothetical protein